MCIRDRDFFERIRTLGLKVDIHSGEGGDAETHKLTLAQLKPDRVAHGFAGCSDNFIFQDNLVMCPLSNIFLRTFAGEPEEHPVFECLEKGLPVAIGSDDPLLLGTSLALEYTFLHALTGQGEDIFNRTQKNARARVLDRGALRQSAIACN
jgi:adenosine deaminase